MSVTKCNISHIYIMFFFRFDFKEKTLKMALTTAERQRRRREKLKNEGKYEEYKKRNKEEAKKSRKKREDNLSKLSKPTQRRIRNEMKENVRKRVEKCRKLKQKVSHTTQNLYSPFKNCSTLGKATTRAKRSLPSTPRRRKAVIKRLFQTEIGADNVISCPPDTIARGLPLETKDLVIDFYEREDISRQAPGRKDVITVRENGIKYKMQTRHLQCSIKEVFAMFKADHSDVKIGKTKFAELRPKHVLLSNKLPHNVCLCKCHENFIMALDALHKQVPEIPNYSDDFPSRLLCAKQSTNCWLNQCVGCKDGQMFMNLFGKYEVQHCNEITWYVWKNTENAHLSKVVEDGTISDLMKYICSILPRFLEHCFEKRSQAKIYRDQHKEVTNDSFSIKTGLLQIDFSENYKCVSQDEIQSAHWAQSQISLFTSALYHSGIIHPIVIASDDLTHSKDTVIPYVDRILEEVPKEIEVLHVWSDGPTSQFKNKYIAAALPTLQEKHQLHITWNFFATSHGKGPVDGIGGSVKRQVWNAVKRRTHTVYNATDFVAAAATVSNVKVHEMSPSELQHRYKLLKLEKIFSNAASIERIRECHFFEVVHEKTEGRRFSDASIITDHFKRDKSVSFSASVGDWVEVDYDGELFPGEIKSVDNKEYLVSVMVRAGKYWKWPLQVDEVFYPQERVIRKLNAPDVVNARGHFKFDTIA